jgi:hypothetical protein
MYVLEMLPTFGFFTGFPCVYNLITTIPGPFSIVPLPPMPASSPTKRKEMPKSEIMLSVQPFFPYLSDTRDRRVETQFRPEKLG